MWILWNGEAGGAILVGNTTTARDDFLRLTFLSPLLPCFVFIWGRKGSGFEHHDIVSLMRANGNNNTGGYYTLRFCVYKVLG